MEFSNFVKLNSGALMPLLGFGTYKMRDPDTLRVALDSALSSGYRLIDTAAVYHNESIIGQCLPTLLDKHGLTRQDVFITTKLDPKYLDVATIQSAVDISLRNLEVDYIDLFLIHWPAKQGLKREDPRHHDFRRECWGALENLFEDCKVLKAIGVSNYTPQHLKELLSHCHVKPAVLQSELHPDYMQVDTLTLCQENRIHFQAYSPLGTGLLASDKRFLDIAVRHGKSIAQILLRWIIEKKCSVVAKSKDPVRIQENSEIFSFSLCDEDMDAMHERTKSVKYCWDPALVA